MERAASKHKKNAELDGVEEGKEPDRGQRCETTMGPLCEDGNRELV